MKHFLVVGAGQLGSRHLQALARYEPGEVAISVVDPSPAALEVARQRYGEAAPAAGVRAVGFHAAIADVAAEDIDFCVVATGAGCRLEVLRELLSRKRVHNLVLEKVLFQSVAQLDEAAALLAPHGARTWVNCPRRQFAGYRQLRELFAGEDDLRLDVSGSNWGLACNAIHFIDLWHFLGAPLAYALDCSGLRGTLASKRPGYREVEGSLAGRAGAAEFRLAASVDDGPPGIQLVLESTRYHVRVEEAAQRCTLTRKADGHVERLPFPLLYQSQLTHRVAQDALQSGRTELTPFAESAALHRPLLAGLLAFFRQHDDATLAVCPIT